jgi:acetylglutamate kinase
MVLEIPFSSIAEKVIKLKTCEILFIILDDRTEYVISHADKCKFYIIKYVNGTRELDLSYLQTNEDLNQALNKDILDELNKKSKKIIEISISDK